MKITSAEVYADFSGIISISGLVLVVPRAMRSVPIKTTHFTRIPVIAFAPEIFGLGAETRQWIESNKREVAAGVDLRYPKSERVVA